MRLAWVMEQNTQPDKKDHYLMQIAAEVRRVLSRNPRRVKLSDFVLTFVQEKPKLTKEQATAISKNRWLGWLGVRLKNKDNDNG